MRKPGGGGSESAGFAPETEVRLAIDAGLIKAEKTGSIASCHCLEVRAWGDLAGGIGMGENDNGPFDYAILYLFFVPNLLVAEFFIRNKHKRIALPRNLKWPAVAAFAVAGLVFAYAIVMVSATHGGKYGKHLLQIVTG